MRLPDHLAFANWEEFANAHPAWETGDLKDFEYTVGVLLEAAIWRLKRQPDKRAA